MMGKPEDEREKGIEGIFEVIMAENFPHWRQTPNYRSRKVRTPSRKKQNTTLRQIIFKLQKIKDKEKIFKEARGKKVTSPKKQR